MWPLSSHDAHNELLRHTLTSYTTSRPFFIPVSFWVKQASDLHKEYPICLLLFMDEEE